MIQILLKQAAFEAQSVALAFLTSTGARPITPDVWRNPMSPQASAPAGMQKCLLRMSPG